MRTMAAFGILTVMATISTGEARRVKRQIIAPGVPDSSLALRATTTLDNGDKIGYIVYIAYTPVVLGTVSSQAGQILTVPFTTIKAVTTEEIVSTPTITPSAKKAETNNPGGGPIGEAPSGGKSNTAAIVGGVVGGIVVLALMTLAIFWFVFRRKPKNDANRTESALALEKLGSESPESPLEGVKPPPGYRSPINTSQPLPPPPPPPPQKQSGGSPVSQQRMDREQPLPPVPSSDFHGGDREDSHLLHHRSQDPDSLLPPLPAAPQLPQFTSGPALSTNSTNRPSPPPPPPLEPAELLSREVDNDGVSVRSFDLERETEASARSPDRSVPRLPMYQKPTGGHDGLPGQAL